MRLPARSLLFAVATLAVGGCTPEAPPPADETPGQGSTPAARERLAAHAAAAQDLSGAMFYTLTAPEAADRTVMVVLAPDGTWRVDVPQAALDGTVDVAMVGTADGTFHCALSSSEWPEPTSCVQVDQVGVEIDPRVQHVFTGWLNVLNDRGAALAVTTTQAPDGVAGECFAVEHSAASLEPPLDAGAYCFEPSGLLTGARLGFGTLTLLETGESAPATVELPGPVVTREPLPIVSPTPPSPSPTDGPEEG